MKNKIFSPLALAFFCLVPAAFAQQSQIAGLSEDVAELRREVEHLRTELEDLRAENARLLELAQKKINPNDEIAPRIAAVRAEFRESLAVLRRELSAETDAKVKALAEMTNRAMADLSKSVNKAAAANVAPSPIARPGDFPDGGIEYTVKSGDTLGKIISQTKSKKNWILYANPGMEPDKIFVGQKIFVPQKD